MAAYDVVPGLRLAEEEVGTNAVGTVLETRQPLLICGREHFQAAYREFSCYGQPIVHPITRRVEGVLNVCGAVDGDHRFFPTIARKVVKDIEESLALSSPVVQQRLLAVFHAAARRRTSPVMVVGEGLVLATPAALDLLDPVDHAAVRAVAAGAPQVTSTRHRIGLASGRQLEFTCIPVGGGAGVVIELGRVVGGRADRRPSAAGEWPLLLVGESGTGRTTEAACLAGPAARFYDAVDALSTDGERWLSSVCRRLAACRDAVVIENVDLLADATASTIAARISGRASTATAPLILTATISGDRQDPSPSLLAVCQARRVLPPLRERRSDIPRMAAAMLADESGRAPVRLTAPTLALLASQPWRGNLTELRQVLRSVCRVRSAGDVVPSDLPAAYREPPRSLSPIRDAERDVILAAIERAGGNKVKAAQALNVSRSTLYNRMRALKIG